MSCEKKDSLSSETSYSRNRNELNISTDKIASSYVQTIRIAQSTFLVSEDYAEFEKLMSSNLASEDLKVLDYLYQGVPANIFSDKLIGSIENVYLDEDFDKLHNVITNYYEDNEFKSLPEENQNILIERLEIIEKSRFDIVKTFSESKDNINQRMSPGDHMIWSHAASSMTDAQRKKAMNAGLASLCGVTMGVGVVAGVLWSLFD
jgi:DNA polymerase III sliding clamp (beta) subunit (PCNA family)